jgi:hypothetical protein
MMIKRGQVFIRGKNKDGRWDHIDVLDLDEISFRAWVVGCLMAAGVVCGLREVEGEDIIPQEKAQP